MREEYQIKKKNINGVIWEYISTGSGESTFLILPGGGQTAQLNFKLIGELKKSYKIIAVTIHQCDSIEEFNKAINTILKEEKANNLIVYGLSIGGLMAQSYLLRNNDKVNSLIISHACTPKSKLYYRKVIFPLKLLNLFLPLIPDSLIRFITLNFSGKVQGRPAQKDKTVYNKDEVLMNKLLIKEFYQKYLNRRLLQTWIRLHLDFYNNEKFTKDSFQNWHGKVLIIRTDNDPLMQDEGEFIKIYPNAHIHTFKGTGHLSFYYQFDEMIQEIKRFLS